MSSSLKLLDQFSPDFTLSLLSKGYCSNGSTPLNKLDAMTIYGTKKKTLKNLLLQNQENFETESWYIALGTTKFVQMMILG